MRRLDLHSQHRAAAANLTAPGNAEYKVVSGGVRNEMAGRYFFSIMNYHGAFIFSVR